MKVRFAIGDYPWTISHPDKLPHLKKLEQSFLELFEPYEPKTAKNTSGAYGYPVYEMEVPADAGDFDDRLKQLHELAKKYKPPAAIALLTASPDPGEVSRARFLKPYYFADFVDEGRYRDALNTSMVKCQECKAPGSKKAPAPFLVNKTVLKSYDVFHTGVSMLVVRPKVLDLLKKVVDDQIEFGEAAIEGAKTKAKGNDRLFWVRPRQSVGPMRREKIGQATCTKCKRKKTRCARAIDDAVKANGRGLFDGRTWVEHFGKAKVEIALVPEPDDDWPEIAMSGRLLDQLKKAGVKGITPLTNQLPAQPLFSERGEPALLPEAAGSKKPASKAKEPTGEKSTRERLHRELALLKRVPWDCQKDGYVYFQLSTPELIVMDPMTGEEDSDGPYEVAKFKGPGLYRLPVSAIKAADGDDRNIAVDSGSLLLVDNAYLADFVEAYDWDKATKKNGDYDPKYQQQVAEKIGIRFGVCSTPPRKFKSQFVGDGSYTIDASRIQPARQPVK